MMKQLLTAACLALITSQAAALSCMRPDMAQTYQWADGSTDTYAVLLGQITYDESGLSERQLRSSATFIGSFTGVQLGPNGQSDPFTQDIALSNGCAGPWCGHVRDDPNTISFVNVTSKGFSFTASPCGGMQFSADDPVVLETLTSCLSGGPCEPQLQR